jgi:membrane fusion protein (multidrug efflux system)
LSDSEIYPELGQKDFVDNQVDPETGTIAVRAIFDNPWNILLPGQYVTVMISCAKGKHLPMVPQAAVQEDRDGRYVFVVDNEQTVVQRRIATGNGIGTEWAVESGLISGDVVVVQGVQKIRPGQIVKTVTADEKSRG